MLVMVIIRSLFLLILLLTTLCDSQQPHVVPQSFNQYLPVSKSSEYEGAVVMLVSNWREGRYLRKCHFNASMDALALRWRPHNPNYPIILMNTKPWPQNDEDIIRDKWSTLEFKFINIRSIFRSVPNISKKHFQDAHQPLATMSYKRMCHFFWKGFTQVPELNEYRYLLRLDDDTCLLNNIEYDLFQAMYHKGASYAYSHIWYDYSKDTNGLYPYINEYIRQHNLSIANPLLYNTTITATTFPAQVPCFNTNFEVIDTIQYKLPALMAFVDSIVQSNMIFHRRWGDAPLRYALALLYWSEREVWRIPDIQLQHSNWPGFPAIPAVAAVDVVSNISD